MTLEIKDILDFNAEPEAATAPATETVNETSVGSPAPEFDRVPLEPPRRTGRKRGISTNTKLGWFVQKLRDLPLSKDGEVPFSFPVRLAPTESTAAPDGAGYGEHMAALKKDAVKRKSTFSTTIRRVVKDLEDLHNDPRRFAQRLLVEKDDNGNEAYFLRVYRIPLKNGAEPTPAEETASTAEVTENTEAEAKPAAKGRARKSKDA